MNIFHSDTFAVPLPPGHRFPMGKYKQLRERLLRASFAADLTFHVPVAATDEQILRVHTPAYLERVTRGQLNDQEIRRIGLPWSPELVERARRSVGGTITACRAALQEGIAFNLSGGTHHAFPDHGEGFCVLNDAGIAARALQAEGHLERILILDADVHQGNGTAAIFAGDPTVFTLSIHGEKNFPFRKVAGDLDIGLPDGAEDDAYLKALRQGTQTALARMDPELVIYLAGADPYRGDCLGRLHVSKAGLIARDRYIFKTFRERDVPVAAVMAGGYAARISDTVDIQFNTIETGYQIAQEHAN